MPDDLDQEYCAHCGKRLDDGDATPTVANDRKSQPPATNQLKEVLTGGGNRLALILGNGVIFAIAGVFAWLVVSSREQREKRSGASSVTPSSSSGNSGHRAQISAENPSSSSEFETRRGFRGGFDSGVKIKYTGSREFKNVQIQLTVSPHFGLSGDERNTYQFASWKSGETQFLKSEGMTLSAKGEGGTYSWSGTAVLDGTEVHLIGGEGPW